MNSNMLNKVVNFIWFQTIWVLVIFTQYAFIWLIGLLFVAFFILSPARRRDIALMITAMVFGSVVDSLLTIFNIFAFNSAIYFIPIPLWLTALWGAFALTLPYSLNYLQGRWWICAFLGSISGPLSYWAGARFGAVIFPHTLLYTLGILAMVWAIVFPACMYLTSCANRFFKEPH